MIRLFNIDDSKANPLWLAFFRCSVSLICLLHFIAIQPDFDTIFSQNAIVPPDLLHAYNTFRFQVFPSVYDIDHFVAHILPVSYGQVLLTVRILYPLSLTALLIGFVPRLSALLSLLLQLVVISSMDVYNYGVDVFTTMALFYCIICPVGNMYSIQNYLSKKPILLRGHAKYLQVIRGHICMAYFFSGFEKLLGPNWRNGESIWKMVHGYNHYDFFNLDFLYTTPFFLVTGWATIMLEMLYPVFINISKTRTAWLWATVSFHVLIALFMGLYFFSAVMIVFNLTCYYVPFIKVAVELKKRNVREAVLAG